MRFPFYGFDFKRRVVYYNVYFFWVICGLVGSVGDLNSAPHVSDTYIHARNSLFFLSI